MGTVARAYGWTLDKDGQVHGLVAGDQCFEATGIVLDEAAELKRMYALMDDIREQYERHKQMYLDAGGKLAKLRGSMTCYLTYDALKAIFEPDRG